MSEGTRPGSWEGLSFTELDEVRRAEVFAMAADYRGDVTLHLEGGEELTGYVFANEPGGDSPHLRLFPKDRDEKLLVEHARVRGIEFSGADKAFGRSWDAWVKRWEAAQRAIADGRDPGEYEPQAEGLD